MITHLNAIELGSAAARGAGLTVSAKRLTAIELGSIAARLKGGAVLHVEDSIALTPVEIGSIAARAKDLACVHFS
ncbi:hypothetical protein [Sphingomonas sp. PP-CE-1G-424]|uniref:hypothetical protein n=1 Tax=Sphingomonas sp. PP-CE-1G-424 TaxID=2135658 RepID=UPI0010544985|nr:hypothetical protein [Sphingomonas sp. PP-CE-1G-424]